MPEGVEFPFPSLLFYEGRTYGQPEVVRISLPQVATGLRLRLPGSFRRRGFQPDLLMPQEALFARGAHSMQAVMHRALLRRERSGIKGQVTKKRHWKNSNSHFRNSVYGMKF